MSVASLAKEYDANPDALLKDIQKGEGIHFRSHRDPSKQGDFVIVKLWHKYPKELLVAFLESRGISVPIIKGSMKWVAIIPREKWEGKVEGKASDKEMAGVFNKLFGKTTTKAKAKASQEQEQKQGQEQETKLKYTLDVPQQQKQTVSVGSSSSSSGGGVTWNPGKYTLAHKEYDLRKLVVEARERLLKK